jgi:cobalt-zinc-cadmium efflux system protein
MFNGLAMLVICGYLFVEAYHRLLNPEPINGLLMIIVASIGLLANLLAVFFLRHDKERNLNVKAAYIHLLADTLSSVAVVIGGVFIYLFEVWWLDPLLTFVIGIYILKETWYIIKQAYNILMQATPPGLNLEAIKVTLETIDGVDNIHHVHAWQLNDEQIHYECHVDLKNDFRISETADILAKLKKVLNDGFGISHTTFQFEYNCCGNKEMVYGLKAEE